MKNIENYLKTVFLLSFIVFGVSCGGSNSSKKTDVVGTSTVDCLSADVQKTLTYCASPEAADLAKQNFDKTRPLDVPVDAAPTIGSDGALVTVVVFTDLECPVLQGRTRLHEKN